MDENSLSTGQSGVWGSPLTKDELADLGIEPLRLTWAEVQEPIDLRSRLVAKAATIESPLGDLVVCWTSMGVSWLRLRPAGRSMLEVARESGRPTQPAERVPAWLRTAVEHIDEPGEDLRVPVDLLAVSRFQHDVLRAAQTIPRGQTRPYAWIAQQIGNPRAVRAVGTALGHNPVPVFVPCHRVVTSGGAVGQYIFGREAKETLLTWEGAPVVRRRGDSRGGDSGGRSDQTT